MFTKQYFNYRKMMFTTEKTTFTSCLGTSFTTEPAYSAEGYNYEVDIGGSYRGTVRFTDITSEGGTSRTGSGIYLGTGITPPTADDIAMESIITSGLSYRNSGYRLFKENDGLYVYESSIELTNTSDANIGISEIGFIARLGTAAYEPKFYPVLFYREVPDEPIHIAPDETRLVTLRINFNQVLNIDGTTGEESSEATE